MDLTKQKPDNLKNVPHQRLVELYEHLENLYDFALELLDNCNGATVNDEANRQTFLTKTQEEE